MSIWAGVAPVRVRLCSSRPMSRETSVRVMRKFFIVEQQTHVGIEDNGALFAAGQFLVEVGRNFQYAETVTPVHEIFRFVEVGAVREHLGVGRGIDAATHLPAQLCAGVVDNSQWHVVDGFGGYK